jgi:hypothetical protein
VFVIVVISKPAVATDLEPATTPGKEVAGQSSIPTFGLGVSKPSR